jgi:hypothetical protein
MAQGTKPARAAAEAANIGQAENSAHSSAPIPHYVRLDFAYASRTVFYVMAGIMAAAAVVAFIGLVPGIQQETEEPAPGLQRNQ